MIYTVLQDVFQDCPVYHVFQKEFIGEKLAGEIQLKIDSVVYIFVEKEKQPNAEWGNHFNLDVARLLKQIADLNVRLELRIRKSNNVLQFDQEYPNFHQEWLESARKQLKLGNELLLCTTLATLFHGE